MALNRVLGMVNVAPGFYRTPRLINGFTELILEAFGEEVGRDARSAISVGDLPFSVAVEIEGGVTIRL